MSQVINIVYVRMPKGIHGASVKNSDDSFTVLLDPNDPPDVQQASYRHELIHIENGDFDNIQDKHVQILEAYAHSI